MSAPGVPAVTPPPAPALDNSSDIAGPPALPAAGSSREAISRDTVVHSIHIAEVRIGLCASVSCLLRRIHVVFFVYDLQFDILKGNTLSQSDPGFEGVLDVLVPGLTREKLGNLCLPDGAHLHEDGATSVCHATRTVYFPRA